MSSPHERAARAAGWKTADLTPNAAVNETIVYENTCAFFQAPEGHDLWRSLCIAYDIPPEEPRKRITLRLPAPLAAQAQRAADAQGISMNDYFILCIERALTP